jgi:hypothetical protein
MRKIQRPGWLLFGEECRDKRMPTLKFGKSPRRAEDSMYRWWLEAKEKHEYPGTVRDWHCLIGYRTRSGDFL